MESPSVTQEAQANKQPQAETEAQSPAEASTTVAETTSSATAGHAATSTMDDDGPAPGNEAAPKAATKPQVSGNVADDAPAPGNEAAPKAKTKLQASGNVADDAPAPGNEAAPKTAQATSLNEVDVSDIKIEGEEDAHALMEASLAGLEKPQTLELGQKIQGEVADLGQDYVFVDIGQKSEAVWDLEDARNAEGRLPKLGTKVEAYVIRINGSEIELGTRFTASEDEDKLALIEEAHAQQLPVEGKVKARNKGGLEIDLFGKRAFCPVSQVELRFCENPEQYVGQTLTFRVIEVAENGRKIVVSRRVILEEEAQEKAKALLSELEEGAEFDGTVTSIAKYGAFVDIGGMEGLVHVSEISYQRVEDPNEALTKGQNVRVKVIKFDPVKQRISLSMKALEGDPWDTVLTQFPEGATVKGRVARMESFGAFISLAPSIDGLIHISELSHKRIRHPREVLDIGDTVEVKIIRVEPDKKRIGLTLKGLQESPYDTNLVLNEGESVEGTVENVESFGVFLRLPNGKTGLIPNGEMATPRNSDHAKMFPNDTKLNVVILNIDPESGKIRLSRKAAMQDKEVKVERENIQHFQPKQTQKNVFGTLGSQLGDLLKNNKN